MNTIVPATSRALVGDYWQHQLVAWLRKEQVEKGLLNLHVSLGPRVGTAEEFARETMALLTAPAIYDADLI